MHRNVWPIKAVAGAICSRKWNEKLHFRNEALWKSRIFDAWISDHSSTAILIVKIGLVISSGGAAQNMKIFFFFIFPNIYWYIYDYYHTSMIIIITTKVIINYSISQWWLKYLKIYSENEHSQQFFCVHQFFMT